MAAEKLNLSHLPAKKWEQNEVSDLGTLATRHVGSSSLFAACYARSQGVHRESSHQGEFKEHILVCTVCKPLFYHLLTGAVDGHTQ